MTLLDHHHRVRLARQSLLGLSVGDAFGERFFGDPEAALRRIATRDAPRAPWPFTDDTVMALSVVDVLEQHRQLDQDRLAKLFAARYRVDPARGYGSGAHAILHRIGLGEPWQSVSRTAFGGSGSMGNGAAMRAAPVGAYFCDDADSAAAAARLSAEVTHGHIEGQAGAVAVASAAAWTAAGGDDVQSLFSTVLEGTPYGLTRAGIERAAQLPLTSDVATAVAELGNGSRVTAQDTVPFCLWCVARHLGDYEQALWTTASALGDRDTTCAIVGGIMALHARARIPPAWIDAREPLEAMSLIRRVNRP